MALAKAIEMPATRLKAAYHRINRTEISFVPDARIPGSTGTIMVSLASYASVEARQAGAPPVGTIDLLLRFGGNIEQPDEESGVVVIPADEPSRADIYAALAHCVLLEGAIEA